jgi:hypothetical protein
MTWIVDVELVGIAPAEPPDIFEVAFDVIYPGETWCRSVIAVSSDLAYAGEEELIRQAREALLVVVEREGQPVSVRLRVTSDGTQVVAMGRPG